MQAVEILKKTMECVINSNLTDDEKAEINSYHASDLVIAELVAERAKFEKSKIKAKEGNNG